MTDSNGISTKSDGVVDDGDYRESEDEDYSPEADKSTFSGDEDTDEGDHKLDAAYSQYQGRGGLIKTRAQRRAEAEGRSKPTVEEKAPPVRGTASVDVDALWKEMNASEKSNTSKSHSGTSASSGNDSSITLSCDSTSASSPSKSLEAKPSRILSDDYITISRTFKFAGEVKTETKKVLRHSAEGQDYLNQQKIKSQGREPVKRKMSLIEEYNLNKTKKINTLEKSRLDWLGFVDKEGIKDDLTKFNKAGYLDRQNFLDRVDNKVDTEIRRQRAKNLQQ